MRDTVIGLLIISGLVLSLTALGAGIGLPFLYWLEHPKQTQMEIFMKFWWCIPLAIFGIGTFLWVKEKW